MNERTKGKPLHFVGRKFIGLGNGCWVNLGRMGARAWGTWGKFVIWGKERKH